MKEKVVEEESLEDLKRIQEECGYSGIGIVVTGGYAVRFYTRRTMRFTKDLDFLVKEKDLERLKGVLKRIGYEVKDRPHGLTGFRRVGRTPISLNVGIKDVEGVDRTVEPYFGQGSVKAKVVEIEDLLLFKARAGRERDLIDICILLLDSFKEIEFDKLKEKNRKAKEELTEKLKFLLDSIGSKKLRSVWEDFMGRKIEKKEEKELWKKLTRLRKKLPE
ncbi:hypothetical protein AKJ57_02105 [candidate division MSBL1 archaeon SCGC-AAA259A05]|uniref:Nucleotidyltransferase n=1 Tax=candidate division MSBL1 archaeon SCGC-AAA259A05 TaxID=1698259 RepID=A0A133UAI1_9EURY|nr:hypothetical protein AKJ57_02105 [candidate division MSBL1 archaeon SCGC-AAA259A05]